MPSSNSGFTLVEIMVALVICTFLIHGVFNLGNYSMKIISHSEDDWDKINSFQEYLVLIEPENVFKENPFWVNFNDKYRIKTEKKREPGSDNQMLEKYIDDGKNVGVWNWVLP